LVVNPGKVCTSRGTQKAMTEHASYGRIKEGMTREEV
jgi:hypothetical protein